MRLMLFLFLLSTLVALNAQADRWKILPNQNGVLWNVAEDDRLPHGDNIEMSGRKVSVVIDYQVDSNRMIKVQRRLIYPQMRPYIKDTDPDWWATYRNYLRRNYSDTEALPAIYLGDRQLTLGPVDSIVIDGSLRIYHQPTVEGVLIARYFYPDPVDHRVIEEFEVKQVGATSLSLTFTPSVDFRMFSGTEGTFLAYKLTGQEPYEMTLSAGESKRYYIVFGATRRRSPPTNPSEVDEVAANAGRSRNELINELQSKLVLETPEPIYNTLFSLSKIRGAESIFDSKLGLVHSPGGERYYAGFWANDQAEYINPFFPYLGYELGNEAARNMYRVYKDAQPDNWEDNIRYSFEMAGDAPVNPLDRGDAAMIAYGLSHYLLALSDPEEAQLQWSFLAYCLEYNHRRLNEQGVVASESDEMEGRIETGDANLATSTLYYAALQTSIFVGEELGINKKQLRQYRERRRKLGENIEKFFGRTVEGLATYRYYDGHEKLRHWIALPLVAGIYDRTEGTIEGLFDRLWTDNGVHVEKNAEDPDISEIFWDRGTLYALRGAFMAGATERAHEKLLAFSRKRLVGERVPYVVEAYPEGDMAHLSAESGLYCRIFLEGLFGLQPAGFNRFHLQPRMPAGWDKMALRNCYAFGQENGFDIEISRANGIYSIRITNEVAVLKAVTGLEGEQILINLPK